MTSEDAITQAMRKLTCGDSLVRVIREAYLDGYRDGDLDRQRLERSVIKPKRNRSRGSSGGATR